MVLAYKFPLPSAITRVTVAKTFGLAKSPTNVPIAVGLQVTAPVVPGGVTPTATIGPVPTVDPAPVDEVIVGAVAPSRKNPALDAVTPYEPEITLLPPQIRL